MIFIDNKYTKWYYSIIHHARSRTKHENLVIHHIIPECFFVKRKRKGPAGWLEGNPDSLENLVALTEKEHFIAHLLLTKMVNGPGKYKVLAALNFLSDNFKVKTSKLFQKLRLQRRKSLKGAGNPMWNRKQTEETKIKIGQKSLGRKFSEESRNRRSDRMTGDGNHMFGQTHSLSVRQKQKQLRLSQSKITCGHCGKQVDPPNFKRWHGDNCKLRSTT